MTRRRTYLCLRLTQSLSCNNEQFDFCSPERTIHLAHVNEQCNLLSVHEQIVDARCLVFMSNLKCLFLRANVSGNNTYLDFQIGKWWVIVVDDPTANAYPKRQN